MPAVTKIAAHRGGWGRTENSVDAMEHAIGIGADMVEFDVQRTADGHLIVRHDLHLLGRPVAELTYEEIGATLGDDGPPLLDDVITVCCGRVLMDVEIKASGYEAETVAALERRCTLDQFVVTSFLDEVVAEVKRVNHAVRCGLLLRGKRFDDAVPWQRVTRCGADFIAPHVSLTRSGLTHRAQRRGIPVTLWTVNGERALRRLLPRHDIETLITDTPAVALRIRDGTANAIRSSQRPRED